MSAYSLLKTHGENYSTGAWELRGPLVKGEGTPEAYIEWATLEPILEKSMPKTFDPTPFYFQFRCCRPGWHCNLCCLDCTDESNTCIEFPCCFCRPFVQWRSNKAGLPPMLEARISEPEDLFGKLMSRTNPKCPPEWQGVFWQRDSSQLERLITFEDGDWEDHGRLALRRQAYGWTFPSNCAGYLFFAGRAYLWQRLEVSPSGRWAYINDKQFIVRINAKDDIRYPEVSKHADDCILGESGIPYEPGAKVSHLHPGDMLRIDWQDPTDPTKGVGWSYTVHRVAHKENGRVVLDPAYKDLLARSQIPSQSCCICCLPPDCCMSTKAAEDLKIRVGDKMYFNLRPENDPPFKDFPKVPKQQTM